MILGSKSLRRQEILSFFNLPFEVVGSSFDERSVPFQGFATDYVETIAVEKSAPLAKQFPDQLILTADTAVHFENKIFNKPLSFEQAFDMLKTLNGKHHEVVSGVCIRKGDSVHSANETTKVQFNLLTDTQIRSYIKAVDVLDKAGAYAIQGLGSMLVKQIHGCYYNVMGLPLNTTSQLFNKVNIDLWQYVTP
ncbi:MAG: Maf family nucleotide pyrophosphatase [Rhabdochlamydiaceae bacterium]|nr:Maf family nucleotide pyrophosphatase [Candidatus Amphrikana amoebophyrae]